MKTNSKLKLGKVVGHAFIESMISVFVLALLLAFLISIITALKDAKQKAIERERAENPTKTP